jgi:hypothetical protein
MPWSKASIIKYESTNFSFFFCCPKALVALSFEYIGVTVALAGRDRLFAKIIKTVASLLDLEENRPSAIPSINSLVFFFPAKKSTDRARASRFGYLNVSGGGTRPSSVC